VCPKCSSESARYSRRHYDGPWSFLLTVRPVKCSDCGAYFPLAADGSIRRPETDPIDLHIPFRPSELDAPAVGHVAPSFEDIGGDAPRTRPSRRACPVCGSEAIRASRPGIEPPTSRLDAKTDYRCVRCNASFRRTNPLRLVVFSLLLLGVLAGLSYLALAALGARGLSNKSPRIRKDQVKEPPPPVFR
jgi:hypothetical protein